MVLIFHIGTIDRYTLSLRKLNKQLDLNLFPITLAVDTPNTRYM